MGQPACHVGRDDLGILPAAAGGKGGVSVPPTAATTAAAPPPLAFLLLTGRYVKHAAARLQPVKNARECFEHSIFFVHFSTSEIYILTLYLSSGIRTIDRFSAVSNTLPNEPLYK